MANQFMQSAAAAKKEQSKIMATAHIPKAEKKKAVLTSFRIDPDELDSYHDLLNRYDNLRGTRRSERMKLADFYREAAREKAAKIEAEIARMS